MSSFSSGQVTQIPAADAPDREYDGTWWRVQIDAERVGSVRVPGSQEASPGLIAEQLSRLSNGPKGEAVVRGLLERGGLELTLGYRA